MSSDRVVIRFDPQNLDDTIISEDFPLWYSSPSDRCAFYFVNSTFFFVQSDNTDFDDDSILESFSISSDGNEITLNHFGYLNYTDLFSPLNSGLDFFIFLLHIYTSFNFIIIFHFHFFIL